MSIKTLEILEQLKSLKQSETAELVKQIEATFDVDASPRAIHFINDTCLDRSILIDEDPPGFDVILEEVPVDKKIAVLKAIRTLTDLGLREAKDFVESAPQVVRRALDRDAAENIKNQLEAVGAKVVLK